ncbi:MAG: glycosyltransferase family 4 protein, partial [Patescibacteria group bacterium]
MKKLLIITTSISVDEGRGRYAVDMIKGLAKDFKMIVFTSQRPHEHENDLKDIDLEIHDLPNTNKLTKPHIYFWYSIKLLPYIFKSDLVHFFSDYPYCVLFAWIPFIKKSIFITVHGTYGVLPLDKLKSKFLLKKAYRRAKKIFCVSTFTQKQILKRIKLDNTVVINNGVDYSKFQSSIGVKKNKERSILGVGELKPRKGYHISIPAIAKVKKRYPDIKYYIVGGKPPKIYVNLVKKYNLENNVKFLFGLSDKELIEFYYKVDIFVLTPITINNNDFEGFGLVYLEAGACGKPVIGTYDCGAEDAIINNVTGFLVSQNN